MARAANAMESRRAAFRTVSRGGNRRRETSTQGRRKEMKEEMARNRWTGRYSPSRRVRGSQRPRACPSASASRGAGEGRTKEEPEARGWRPPSRARPPSSRLAVAIFPEKSAGKASRFFFRARITPIPKRGGSSLGISSSTPRPRRNCTGARSPSACGPRYASTRSSVSEHPPRAKGKLPPPAHRRVPIQVPPSMIFWGPPGNRQEQDRRPRPSVNRRFCTRQRCSLPFSGGAGVASAR